MKLWQGIALTLGVIAIGMLIRADYPWFPYLGLTAGLSFGIGTWVGRSKK